MSTEPGEHCYIVMQDHGPNGGGWGPAAMLIAGSLGPIIYTGTDERTIATLEEIVPKLALGSGKETRLIRYGSPETLLAY